MPGYRANFLRTPCQSLKQNFQVSSEIEGLHAQVQRVTNLNFASSSVFIGFVRIKGRKLSQLGYLLLLADQFNRFHVLACCSKKSKRVVRYIMAGEVFAFSSSFDYAFVVLHDIEMLLKLSIAIEMFTDSKQLIDVISKASHSTVKRAHG